MIDGINDILSKEAALGIGLYVAAAYLAAGPISARIAERDHLQACVSGAISKREVTSQSHDDTTIALEIYRQSMQKLPGPLGDILSGTVNSAAQQAEQLQRKRADDIATAAPDKCRCMISLALSETRIEWAYYVGSLKLYQPASVSRFGDVIAGANRNGVCSRSS